ERNDHDSRRSHAAERRSPDGGTRTRALRDEPLDGGSRGTRQPQGGVGTGSSEPGQSRHRRDDNGRATAVFTGALGTHSRGTTRGDVSPSARETGRDPQERRWDSLPRDSDGARPFPPAGDSASAAAESRPDLFGAQLRLST